MDRHHILLIIHLISATIWVGGHLILLLGFLPKALKHKKFLSFISRFEKTYEPIGDAFSASFSCHRYLDGL